MRGQRVVFMTGGACTPRAPEFLRKLPHPHLKKPFDAPTLFAAIRMCLERRGSTVLKVR